MGDGFGPHRLKFTFHFWPMRAKNMRHRPATEFFLGETREFFGANRSERESIQPLTLIGKQLTVDGKLLTD
jgi:hypothetical protein